MAMVTWDKVPNLPPNLKAFGNSFNRRFPGRDGGSDGAWGDDDHKLSPSGHNLDDTVGSRPESEDSDSKPELRAIDVDADLRESGVTMQAVADAIIADPDVQRRMSYVIFNRRIAGAGTKWKWVAYNGDNDHTHHLHGSGKADADENGAPFSVIENFGKSEGDDELSERASKMIEAMGEPSGTRGLDVVPKKNSPFQKIEQIFDRLGPIESSLSAVKADLAALKTRQGTSDAASALQAGVVTPLSIEKNLTVATDKQLQAELDRRAKS